MRLIDVDALINEIKKETKKAIEQDDKVGSFWLGYIAGLVIKQPTIQSALEPETLIRTIEMGITATNSNDAYSLGMRNGMRWCKSLIDGVEPKFEDDVTRVDDGKELPPAQPEPHWIPVSERMPEEHEWIGTKKFGTTISDEVYVTFENEKGERFCQHMKFQNGELSRYDQFHMDTWFKGSKPIAWMPLPTPYKK